MCALKGQRKAAELIFGAITSLRFLELMYPDDNAITRQKRMTFLAALYLNMPDKGVWTFVLYLCRSVDCALYESFASIWIFMIKECEPYVFDVLYKL